MIYCTTLQHTTLCVTKHETNLDIIVSQQRTMNIEQVTYLTMNKETSKMASHLPLLGADV